MMPRCWRLGRWFKTIVCLLERERIHLLLIDDAKRGLADIAAGRTKRLTRLWRKYSSGEKAIHPATVIPNLRRFPRIGRPYLANPPQSAEALALLASLPVGATNALRGYLHGDYLMLYTVIDESATVYLLSIRHHRQLSFDFAGLWP